MALGESGEIRLNRSADAGDVDDDTHSRDCRQNHGTGCPSSCWMIPANGHDVIVVMDVRIVFRLNLPSRPDTLAEYSERILIHED